MNTRRLTTIAMLTAIYVVLSIMTPVKVANFKFTFEAFPILVAGMLLGPVDGLITGTLGSFIYQLFFSGYGITATTPLWILPHAVSGLLTGLLARTFSFDLDFKKIMLISSLSAVTVTALNILALYVDSKMYGYYSPALVFGNIAVKIAVGIILALIYSGVMPRLLSYLKKQTGR
ncbi:MAG: folate family ECF transporter S component [Erysipelotrichaceae bacterium]|nr:folate family ECF transporter S component [Erysipelotrichaceae bacterium]